MRTRRSIGRDVAAALAFSPPSGNFSQQLDITCDESEGANNISDVQAFGTDNANQCRAGPDVLLICGNARVGTL